MIKLNNKKIFPIGFGCGPLGVHGFGKVDLVECRKSVQMAVDEGVNFFDTSDAYGKGLSEEQLSLALGDRRKDVIISTKGSIRFDKNNHVYYDCSPKWLSNALNRSLVRLKTDYIDLYQIHYWDNKTPFEDIFGFMENLCSIGKIHAYGVSNLNLAHLEKSFFKQFPNLKTHSDEFSMVQQEENNYFETLLNKQPDSIFLASGVLAQGLLTGKYSTSTIFSNNDRRSKSNYTNLSPEFITNATPIIEELKRHGYKPATLAIAWVLKNLNKSIALVGVKSRDQLKDALYAINIISNEFDWSAIDAKVERFKNHDSK